MKKINLMFASLILLLGVAPAHADDMKYVIDGNFGLQSFNQGIGGKFAYGAGLDVRLGSNLQVGVEYRRAKLASDDDFDISANSYLVNGLYRVAAGPGTFGIGLELGETEVDFSANGGFVDITLASESEFVVGPKAVYQFSLSEHWEAAANVDYLLMTSSPKYNAFGALASISYSL
jgi:hypothetical protein